MLKTWDIFDTLIARRCVHPHSIFVIVEHITKLAGFHKARIVAEQNLVKCGVNYNLDDIYDEFSRITNTKKNLCDELKKIEVDVEIDQSIPITENLRQVKAGDVLISDMYLPEKVIRKMLDKAGLFAPVEIVVTSSGKASGRIWKQLADQNEFIFHIGDNEKVDVQGARKYGFDSRLSAFNRLNDLEQYLMQRDFAFGAYLREIRLRNPFTEETKRKYWTLFTINVGILIIFVQLIDDLQKKYGFEYLGFCGRDTYYLWLLYKKYKETLGEEPPANDYLHYSRKLVHRSKDNLVEYVSSKIAGRKAILIDLVGTGVHLHHLRLEENLNCSMLVACHFPETMRIYYPTAKSYPENWILFDGNVDAFSRSFCFFNNTKFRLNYTSEPLNHATHNSPVRLNNLHIGDKIIPKIIFSEINDTENFDVLETCMKEVLNSKIVWGGVKNQNSVENLDFMLNLLSTWGEPVLSKLNDVTNESIDRDDFLKDFEEQYSKSAVDKETLYLDKAQQRGGGGRDNPLSIRVSRMAA